MEKMIENWRLLSVAALAALLYPLYQYFFHPLSRYPGPLLAKFTNYWRYRDVRGRKSHLTRVALHEKHGPVVRVGPNTLSISDPTYIPKIYGPGQGFLKVCVPLPLIPTPLDDPKCVQSNIDTCLRAPSTSPSKAGSATRSGTTFSRHAMPSSTQHSSSQWLAPTASSPHWSLSRSLTSA